MYRVSVYVSPCPLPISFAYHSWFVVEKDGQADRWEVLYRKKRHGQTPSHLYKNFIPPEQGVGIFLFLNQLSWRGRLIGSVEGGEGSLAQRMAEHIERSGEDYRYRDIYSLFGPNSNTYVESVLKKFPEARIYLPSRCIGRSFAPAPEAV